MPDNKMKNQYSENSERQRMAAIKEMEKYPSPMTKAFLRPAYDRTEICPDFSRRPSNQNQYLCGEYGTVTACHRADTGLSCEFVERSEN